jgi:hypothetical protein
MLTKWHFLSAKKLALTSLTSGGRSVGIVRLRTEATELFHVLLALSGWHITIQRERHIHNGKTLYTSNFHNSYKWKMASFLQLEQQRLQLTISFTHCVSQYLHVSYSHRFVLSLGLWLRYRTVDHFANTIVSKCSITSLLVGSKRIWRRCIPLRTTAIVNLIHNPVF